MEKQTSITLFHNMHPDFFEKEHIQRLSVDWIFDEMILPLDEFEMHRYEKTFDASVTFGFFTGEHSELLKTVEQVDSGWPEFFGKDDRILCGYMNGI